MNEQLEKIMVWLAEDIMKPKPTITSCPFSLKELAAAMEVDWPDELWREMAYHLQEKQVIAFTNKIGPDGTYYNLHPRVIYKYRNNQHDINFVADLINKEEGFCFVYGARKTYRLLCAGRNCRFYLASEKRCVKQKFFLE